MEDITDADYIHTCIIKVIHHFWLMFLKTSEKCVIQNLSFRSCNFLSAPGLAWQAALKKTEVKWELLTDIDVLLMVEKGIKGGICHTIHRYTKANNKYMKDYDTNKE